MLYHAVCHQIRLIYTVYCTSTKYYYLFNLITFTETKDAVNFICVKYYEIGINL